MAWWDHADLLDLETKACIYPEASTTEEIKRALKNRSNAKAYGKAMRSELKKRKTAEDTKK